MISEWEKLKEKFKQDDVKPWDILNPNNHNVDEKTFNDRFDLCKKCPELIQLTKQCKKCGCFMIVKTKLEKATCPIGKW